MTAGLHDDRDAAGGSAGMGGTHTIGRWLDDRAAASPASVAISDRGVTIRYSELADRARALSQVLLRAGYRAGDRIATVSGNSIDHVVAFFACAHAGIAFVPLSWRLTPRELATQLLRAAPQLLLLEDEYASFAEEALSHTGPVIPTASLGTTGVEAYVPPRRPAPRPGTPPRPAHDDDVLLVIFTSGSEAEPKGVMLTHANCFWNNLALAGVLQLSANDIILALLPQFHVGGWNVQPLLAWWVGATVVLERSFQPSRVLQLIAEHHVSVTMGVPTQYQLLADDPRFGSTDLSSLRFAQVGGGAVTDALADHWVARGIPLVQGYGLTEAGPNVLSATADDSRAGCRPYPHVDVCLVDPESGLVLEGEATGELWVRGPGVFAGYLGAPDATARAMRGDWLRTGDLVRRDGDGAYRIVDRLKDIYISGGENVAPAEVEQALCLHPLVSAAAVVGVPDRVWGERGVAFVVLRQGSVASEDELTAHARKNLAAFKVPVRIVQVDDLPRSAIDKLARSRLRETAIRVMDGGHHEQHAR